MDAIGSGRAGAVYCGAVRESRLFVVDESGFFVCLVNGCCFCDCDGLLSSSGGGGGAWSPSSPSSLSDGGGGGGGGIASVEWVCVGDGVVDIVLERAERPPVEKSVDDVAVEN